MDQRAVTTNDLMELLEFLKEHMVMREDLEDFVKRAELIEFKTEILTAIDSFAKKHESHDQELLMIRNRQDRVEGRMTIVEHKIGIST